jgi:non-ribosomal peptide synthetase component F
MMFRLAMLFEIRKSYYWNEQGDQVGYNEFGEIVVCSKYLSPGYWRNPELTATKFKQDPIDSKKRLYYSGDLGLMLLTVAWSTKGERIFASRFAATESSLVRLNEHCNAILP